MAYLWLIVAAALGVAATRWDTSGGIWGASRHDSWVHLGDDPERGATHPAGVRWNEDALEHETYVRGACVCHTGLHAVCFLRDHRLPGLYGVGMVHFADFRALRACGIHNLGYQHSRYVHPSAQPRTNVHCSGVDYDTHYGYHRPQNGYYTRSKCDR